MSMRGKGWRDDGDPGGRDGLDVQTKRGGVHQGPRRAAAGRAPAQGRAAAIRELLSLLPDGEPAVLMVFGPVEDVEST